MSVCAVVLCKDEADVIEPIVRHLVEEVDELVVADNLSTDGTAEMLHELRMELPFHLRVDEEPAYYQSAKTTALAEFMRGLGHDWVVPCDADEWWYAPAGRTIASYLGGMGREVQFVEAALFNHLPTAEDPPASCTVCRDTGKLLPDHGPDSALANESCTACGGRVEPNPVARIGWRQREAAPLPKVACRLRPGLEIRQGNHSAWAPGAGLTAGGLTIRHFSWRSPEQFVRKVRNGAAAYAATDLPADVGAHWRNYGQTLEEHGEQALVDHYLAWFFAPDPGADATLIYDPAPARGAAVASFADELPEQVELDVVDDCRVRHLPGCDSRGETMFCARDCPYYNGWQDR